MFVVAVFAVACNYNYAFSPRSPRQHFLLCYRYNTVLVSTLLLPTLRVPDLEAGDVDLGVGCIPPDTCESNGWIQRIVSLSQQGEILFPYF